MLGVQGLWSRTGGASVKEKGVCSAAIDKTASGLNNGTNGGRICWAVSGTLCGDGVQGTHAQKDLSCLACKFYIEVKNEEGSDFQLMRLSQKI